MLQPEFLHNLLHPSPAAILGFLGFLLSVGCVFTILLFDVDLSGTWDGDPSKHTLHVQATVNDFVKQVHADDGKPSRSFLLCFARFPKMLHEMLVSVFILFFNGLNKVSFLQAEYYQAWFSSICSIIGLSSIFYFIRRFFRPAYILTAFPIFALCGYILMYANFPRHNMPAHMFVWIATSVYILLRTSRRALSPATSIPVGVLFGMAVPVHYSSVYWFFGLLVAELALLTIDRKPREMLLSLFIIFSTAAVVWLVIDLYYFYAIQIFHSVKSPINNKFIAEEGYSFLRRMMWCSMRLSNEAMADKLEPSHWWFIFGFWWRNFGAVGTFLLLLGFCRATSMVLPMRNRQPEALTEQRFILIILSLTILSVLISLDFFQNARKLMPFFPAWAVLITLGCATLHRVISSKLQPLDRPFISGTTRSILTTLLTACAIIVTHGLTYGEDACAIFSARREAGYMREYMAKQGIKKVLVFESFKDSPMVSRQRRLTRVTPEEADKYRYVVFNQRLFKFRDIKGLRLLDCLREIEPLAVFPNQASLHLFWYEFPVKKTRFNFDDPMITSRRLYRWQDVRDHCLSLMQDSGCIFKNNGKTTSYIK